MKYVVKKIIIGVALFLIISFLKGYVAFAYTRNAFIDLQQCTTTSGITKCNSNPVRSPLNSTFTLPKGTFIKNISLDYGNVNLANNGSSPIYYRFTKYLESFFVPVDTTSCPDLKDNSYTQYKLADYLNAKNLRIIDCQYVDNQDNIHSCYEDIFAPSNYTDFLSYRNFVNEDNFPNIYGTKGYFLDLPKLINVGGFNEQFSYYLRVSPGTEIKSISFKFGGFGNYVGNVNKLASNRTTTDISPYYLDYPLINGCTFSMSSPIDMKLSSWNNNNTFGFDFSSAINNPSLISNGYLLPLSSSELEQEITNLTGDEQLQTDIAMQDRLIGYNEEETSTKEDNTLSYIKTSIDNRVSSSSTLFYDFLALPINLLRENANYDIYEDIHGSGAIQCQSYASEYLTNTTYNNVRGVVSLKFPFVNTSFNLDCFNSNVLSPYNRYFGSFYNNDSNKGLDKTLRPIWHVILTGLLSYRVIVSYFKLIKEIYDPDDMSIEVLDL